MLYSSPLQQPWPYEKLSLPWAWGITRCSSLVFLASASHCAEAINFTHRFCSENTIRFFVLSLLCILRFPSPRTCSFQHPRESPSLAYFLLPIKNFLTVCDSGLLLPLNITIPGINLRFLEFWSFQLHSFRLWCTWTFERYSWGVGEIWFSCPRKVR